MTASHELQLARMEKELNNWGISVVLEVQY
jgi:hypothetical protein